MPMIEGRCTRTGDVLTVRIEDHRISDIRRARSEDPTLPWLVTGLIDLQVNGYAGHDVNGNDASPESVAAITHALAEVGITTWVPTIVTASEEAICHSLAAIEAARREDPAIAATIPFAHIEGPFISPQDGPRGAHDADQIRPLDAEEVARWRRHGPVGYVTVSPHEGQDLTHIRRIVDTGVSVAIGHTHASAADVLAATDAGATLSTHLGNGIFPTLPRHPNALWAQLADDRLTTGLIGDGHHLPSDTLTAMVRAKGPGRCFLVSDSVALAGCEPGTYTQPVGGSVELHPDGRLTLANSALLAGSAAHLGDVVRFCLLHTPLGLAQVIELASATPARVLHDPSRGRLQVGAVADLLQMDPGGRVLTVMAGGRWIRR